MYFFLKVCLILVLVAWINSVSSIPLVFTEDSSTRFDNFMVTDGSEDEDQPENEDGSIGVIGPPKIGNELEGTSGSNDEDESEDNDGSEDDDGSEDNDGSEDDDGSEDNDGLEDNDGPKLVVSL